MKKARQNGRMNSMKGAIIFIHILPSLLRPSLLPSFLALLITRLPNQPSSPWSSSPPFSPLKKLFKNRNLAAVLPEHRLPPPLRRRRTFHLSPSSPFLVHHSSTSWLRRQHSKGAFVATFVVYTTWWVFSRFWVQACEQEEFGGSGGLCRRGTEFLFSIILPWRCLGWSCREVLGFGGVGVCARGDSVPLNIFCDGRFGASENWEWRVVTTATRSMKRRKWIHFQ